MYIQSLPTKECHVIYYKHKRGKKKIDFLCSWLYNMFADGLASHLKDQLTEQVRNCIIFLLSGFLVKVLRIISMNQYKLCSLFYF